MTHKHGDFDIDIDLAPLFDFAPQAGMVDARYYQMAEYRLGRDPRLQLKTERLLRNAILCAQWKATRRRPLDRRRAIRVPLLSRLHLGDGTHMVSTDISLSGMRASGEPLAPVMDVEFKVPGLKFPIDARVEVMSYKPANVIPLVGLRFVDIDLPYSELIAKFIGRRRQRDLANAA